ncbi:ABC transporter substrate-binding protein [Victivallis lenta]|nr:extracellular solute-binding protein [Victivallis lenta]
MKKIFLIIASVLIAASAVTVWTRKESSDRPSIVWTAGLSQDRVEQVELFHRWLVENGYTAEDGGPLFTVRLESAGNQSVLIQAVSGMAGDLIDHVPVKRFAPMGVLEDITEFARENGLDPGSNYGAARGLLMYNGRQYAYPCNLAAVALVCNADLFRRYGMEPPPEEWTPEEFERIGLEFTRRANAGRARQEVFFAGAIPRMLLPLARSMGGDVFNETLTAPRLTDEAFVRALKLYLRWVAELHLIPDAAEIASESADGSSVNGQATPQLVAGRYGMIVSGRYVNMDLRRFRKGPVALSFSQFPEYGFKNLILSSRNTAIYRGAKEKRYAEIFLLYLAGKEYNELIINGSDGLPPNPKWAADNPDYHTPPGREYEGNLHTNELRWARTIAIPESFSPYYPLADNRIEDAYNRVANNLCTPEKALEIADRSIAHSIRETVEGTPSLRERYRRACELQKKIDERKAAGRKIPAAWISNPFHLKYYGDAGKLE